MQGTMVMLMALSGLGCHHKACDTAYVSSCYSGGCYGGCYASGYSTIVEPACYSACYSGCYSGCYGGYGGYGGYAGCYGGGCYGGGCYGGIYDGCGGRKHGLFGG